MSNVNETVGPLVFDAIALTQPEGIVALIDMEHVFKAEYAASCGVELETLLICQPDGTDDALELASLLIASNSIDLLVILGAKGCDVASSLSGQLEDTGTIVMLGSASAIAEV